ncbi:hypothetical protein Ae201684P_005992 [Aphanomyces euteiches]|nr:hypothetical protein Ae201684P_005992 [Aphanomyces euteiches]
MLVPLSVTMESQFLGRHRVPTRHDPPQRILQDQAAPPIGSWTCLTVGHVFACRRVCKNDEPFGGHACDGRRDLWQHLERLRRHLLVLTRHPNNCTSWGNLRSRKRTEPASSYFDCLVIQVQSVQTAVSIPPFTTAPTPVPSTSATPTTDPSSSNTGAIAAAFGGAIGGLIVIGLIWRWVSPKKQRANFVPETGNVGR